MSSFEWFQKQYGGSAAAPSEAANALAPEAAAEGPAPGSAAWLFAQPGMKEKAETASFNPEAVIHQSPLSAIDRAALSTGNTPGALKYLKKRYEDAKEHEGSLYVKQNGSWYAADPKGWGTGSVMDKTKEFGRDVADWYGDTVVQGAAAIGGAAGLASPVPGGMAVGATAGAVAGATAKTALGRQFGTYEATPEEQIKQIGWEGVMNAAGIKAAEAAPAVFGALKTIGAKGSSFAKDNLASVWEHLTGAPRWALRRTMDNTSQILAKQQGALKQLPVGTSPLDAVDLLQQKQNKIVQAVGKQADEALQKQYLSNHRDFLAKVPDSYQANVSSAVDDTLKDLAAAGYGKFVPAGQHVHGAGKVMPISGSSPAKPAQQEMVFQLYSDKEIAAQMGIPDSEVPKVIGDATRGALEHTVAVLSKYKKAGTLQGKAGAQKVLQLKKAVNESLGELLGDGMHAAPPAVKQIVAKTKGAFETRIGQTFADGAPKPAAGEMSLAEAYAQMNNNYSSAVEVVRKMKDLAKEPDALVKHLVSKAGSNRMLKDEAHQIAQLLDNNGYKGSEALNSLLDHEAAKHFVDFVPKNWGGNSATTLMKGVAAVGQQTNPRVVARTIQAGRAANDFLQSLGPKQLDAFLRNDQAVSTFARTFTDAYSGEAEDAMTQTLLKNSGLMNGPQ